MRHKLQRVAARSIDVQRTVFFLTAGIRLYLCNAAFWLVPPGITNSFSDGRNFSICLAKGTGSQSALKSNLTNYQGRAVYSLESPAPRFRPPPPARRIPRSRVQQHPSQAPRSQEPPAGTTGSSTTTSQTSTTVSIRVQALVKKCHTDLKSVRWLC